MHSFSNDFLKDLLCSEISEDKIHIYTIKDNEYARTVNNLILYKKVAKDLLNQFIINNSILIIFKNKYLQMASTNNFNKSRP